MALNAVITAGGLCDDPLFAVTQVRQKALIPLAGRPMISWLIDAVVGTGLVDNLVIVGLAQKDIPQPAVPTHFLEAQGSLLKNLLAAQAKILSLQHRSDMVLLCASDIPLVTPAILLHFITACRLQHQVDVFYPIIKDTVMAQQFPQSKRTFAPCKDGRYTGGDVLLIRADLSPDFEIVEALIGSRKDYLQQMRLLGGSFLLRFLARQLTAEQGVAEVGLKVGVGKAKTVPMPYAEIGMDLDTAHHYHLIQSALGN